MDESYADHEDCRGHTGSMMSLRQGAVTSLSRNQKIQGKSSTKDELIGVDDSLPQELWTNYFMKDQGYLVDRNLINQYNNSAILMETNGNLLSLKRTNKK